MTAASPPASSPRAAWLALAALTLLSVAAILFAFCRPAPALQPTPAPSATATVVSTVLATLTPSATPLPQVRPSATMPVAGSGGMLPQGVSPMPWGHR